MKLFTPRLVIKGFNTALPAVRRGFAAMIPITSQFPAMSPQRAAAFSYHRFPRWHTTAMPQHLAPTPNPTPWHWRTHPRWPRLSPFAHQAPRAAMAGLASIPSATVPRGGGFALGGVDDFDPVPEAPVAPVAPVATPIPTAADSSLVLTPETTPVLSQEQRALLPTATDDFREVREQGLLFVDKSGFISELLRDSTKASLITRPRRSGKTTAMKMAECFLNQRYRDQNVKWFEGLAVMDDPEAVGHMGKYPVIFLDLKSAGASSYGAFLKNLARQMYLVYQAFPELDSLQGKERLEYENIVYNLQRIRDDIEPLDESRIKAWESPLANSLVVLTRLIETSTRQKSWVIVDEHDAPVDQAFSAQSGRFHKQVIEFMTGFLGSALKGNPHLHKAVMTGINPVLGWSYGTNNVMVRHVLSNHYAQHFGFTEPQVQWLLGQFGHDTDMTEVRRWYNGYSIGGHMLYNPVSVIGYIDGGFRARPYWVNTGRREDSVLVSRLQSLQSGYDIDVLQGLSDMVGSDVSKPTSITPSVDTSLIVDYDGTTKAEDIWSLMLNQGYLTYKDGRLSVPNIEVSQALQNITRRWLSTEMKVDIHAIESALRAGDMKGFYDIIKVAINSFGGRGIGSQERHYQSFLLGVFSLVGGYTVKSELPSGNGRLDIALIPVQSEDIPDHTRPALIIELKNVDSFGNLEGSLDSAIEQIKDRKYFLSLPEGQWIVMHVGMSFHGRDMRAGHQEFSLELSTKDRALSYTLRSSDGADVIMRGTKAPKLSGTHADRLESVRSKDDKSHGR